MAKFKDLTTEDKQYLTHFYYDRDMCHAEKMEILTKKYEVSERTVRRWWREELNLSQNYTKLPPQLVEAQNRQIDNNTDILLVTAAQNKTGINGPLLENMKSYKEFLTAVGYKTQIVVAPARYRNPTSPTEQRIEKEQAQEWWRDEVQEYMYFGKLQFGDVIVSTDSRILPTASRPLTNYEVLAKDNSLILPHPRIHFKVLPRFKDKPLRSMSTTGFLTHKNYSDSRTGERGFQHHSYGFVVIEKKSDNTCHIPRNVKANIDGDFTDLIYEVKNKKVKRIKSTKGIILGDLHAAEANMEIFNKTLDLYPIFKPSQTVVHDALDASTVNPHEQKDMFIQRLKIREKRYLIEDEIEHCFDLLGSLIDTKSELNVIISNHDIFLDRHINDGNWKKDLHNSPTYLKMALIQQEVDLRDYGSIFGYMVKERFGDNVNYVNFGDSLEIGGYQCAMHGDHGSNGSRGSALTFSKLNTKMIGGHSHTPIILDGYTGVGVMCNLNQYYTRKGLSSWAHCHSIIHNNNKNQLLVFGNDYKFSELI